MQIRLDKYISNLGLASRREIPRLIHNDDILVNGLVANDEWMKVSSWDIITFGQWGDIEVKEFVYVMLHKPAGYVCSDLDEWGYLSYRSLLQDCPYWYTLHVAGRLDQDTEGLVIASNDGQFMHRIKSPKHKLEKEYYVQCKNPISDEDIISLCQWVVLDDGYKTLPAQAEKIGNKEIKLVLHEGKYHQVKRMLEAVHNAVIYLRRDRIGNYTLNDIEKGKRIYFTP